MRSPTMRKQPGVALGTFLRDCNANRVVRGQQRHVVGDGRLRTQAEAAGGAAMGQVRLMQTDQRR